MSAEIISALKAMKLHGMASNYPEVAAQARHTEFTPEAYGDSTLMRPSVRQRRIAYSRIGIPGIVAPTASITGSMAVVCAVTLANM